jgi:hypothetical protein
MNQGIQFSLIEQLDLIRFNNGELKGLPLLKLTLRLKDELNDGLQK